MVCETRLRPRQTLTERKAEIKQVIADVNSLIAAGRIRIVVDKRTGAVAFEGFSEDLRNGVTDACVYRQLMVTGSFLTKQKIAAAEQLAGRAVNKQAVGQGVHSHDGGKTWHNGH